MIKEDWQGDRVSNIMMESSYQFDINIRKRRTPTISTEQGQTVYLVIPIYFVLISRTSSVSGVLGLTVGECLNVGLPICGPTSSHLSTGRLTASMTLWLLK